MTPWIRGLVSALLPLVVAGPALADAAEDAKLAAFFKDYLEKLSRERPLEATRLGDHRQDDRLDDLSPDALKARRELDRKTLADLPKAVAFDRLGRDAQIDYEILAHSLRYAAWQAEHADPFADDPRVYNEYISDSVFLILTQSTLPPERNLRNAAARIGYVPKIVEAARKNLKRPAKAIVETAIRQNRGSIGFYEKGVFELSGSAPQVGELAGPARAAAAALKEYQKFLEEELLPRADGEWRIGKERFAAKLELELNAGITADELLAEAEKEAERVLADMALIARQLWSREFPGKPVPPDDAAGRSAMIRAVLAKLSADRSTPETLVKDARGTVDRLKKFIAERDILRLPDPDRCKVVAMPEFQWGNSVAYLNPAPPLDPKADSVYAISPPPREWDDRRRASFFEEYNGRMLQILTVHEAYPGHYVQLEYANRCPSLVRKVLYSGVFAEGWAVYTEQMMLDQGYGDGDLGMRLFQLKWYLRAVINAILDHKMHCSGMTDTEAMKLLTERAFQTEGEAAGKVVRSKQSSCQLSTYFAGRTAFYRLRQAVSREQGDAFELGRFHEAVLDHGTPPVKYLPELVRERLKRPR